MSNKKPLFIIDEQQPGSIVKDFSMFLAFVEKGNCLVSKKLLHFPTKDILTLNSRMTTPLKHDYVRPQHKLFPHVATLNSCAQVLKLLVYKNKGAKKSVQIDKKSLNKWNSLNETEQYFSLLQTWLVNDDAGLSFPLSQLNWFQNKYLDKLQDSDSLKRLSKEYQIKYFLPGLELFGLCDIEQYPDKIGGGWNIKKLQLSPITQTLLPPLIQYFKKINTGYYLPARQVPKEFAYTLFSSSFPHLKKTYEIPIEKLNRKGVYVFNVSLEHAWRTIEIHGSYSLEELADTILYFFDFENDHLHNFTFIDPKGISREYTHIAMMDALENEVDGSTKETTIESLPITLYTEMVFLFDFGDSWEFKLELMGIKNNARSKKIVQTRGLGEAPKQYPDWDED